MADPNTLPAASVGLDAGQPVQAAPAPINEIPPEDLLPAPPPLTLGQQAKRGFGAGVGGLESAAGGYVRGIGNAVTGLIPGPLGEAGGAIEAGGKAIAEAGKEKQEANPAPVAKLSDINKGNFGDFFAYTLGSSAPALALMALGGMAGKRLAGGSELGEVLGAGMAGGAQTAGEVYNEALNQNLPDPGMRAATAGLATGALYSVPVGKVLSVAGLLKGSPVLSRLFGEATGDSVGSRIESIAKEALTTGTAVAGVNAAASGITSAALNESPEQTTEGMKLAAAQGIALGVPLGGLAAGLGHVRESGRFTGRERAIESNALANELPEPPAPTPGAVPAPAGAQPTMHEAVENRPLPEINKDIELPLPQVGLGVPEVGRNPTGIKPSGIGMTMDEIANAAFDPSRLSKVMGGFDPPAIPLDSVEAASAAATAKMHAGLIEHLNVKQYEKGGKYATGQERVEGVDREEHIDRGVGGGAESTGGSDSLEHGPQGRGADTFSPGLRSGDKTTLLEVARLKERNGFGLTDEEATALRRADLSADVPVQQSTVSASAFDRTTFVRDYLANSVQEVGQGLRGTALTKITDTIMGVLDKHGNNPEKIAEAVGTVMRNMKLQKFDKETFGNEIAEKLELLPRTFYSKAATAAVDADGRVALTMRPDGTAEIRGAETQKDTTNVVRMAPEKIYSAIDWRTDPLYQAALAEAKGEPQTAQMLYKRNIVAQGYEAILHANGRVEMAVPQTIDKVLGLEQHQKLAKEISTANVVHGGSTYDLNTGENLAHKQGYAVAVYADRERKIRGYPTSPEIRAYMQEHYDALSLPGNTLGTWFNRDDGFTYLDVSRKVDTVEEAQQLAAQTNQLAIFDLGTMQQIPSGVEGITRTEDMRAAGEANYDGGIAQQGQAAVAYIEKIIGAPERLQVGVAPQLKTLKGENVAGFYRAGKYKDTIALAYMSQDIMSNAAHEGYHYIEQRVLQPTEIHTINRALRPGTPVYTELMAKLRSYDILNKTKIADEARTIPQEMRAYAFQFWRNGAFKAETALGRIWQKVKDVVDRVKNFVDGNGFRTYSDIFSAIEHGEYARLERDGLRTNSNLAEAWFGDVEPDAIPGAGGVFGKIGAGPAEGFEGPVSKAKGRPWWVQAPADVARMRGILRSLAMDGDAAGARDWHTRSGAAIMKLANGDKAVATTIAKLIATFSPRTPVGADMLKALRAYAQFRAGVEIDPGAPKQHIDAARKILAEGGEVTGIKRENFYQNLMQMIDPDNYGVGKQGATIDMWMAHAFGFAKDVAGTVNKSEYRYANVEMQRLAREMGWRVDEAQAAVWVAIKARANYVRPMMEKFAASQGWYEFKLTKNEAAGQGDMFGQIEGKKRVIRADKQRDYVMNWMNMAMQAEPPREEFAKANYSYAEALKDLDEGKLDLRLQDEAAVQAAQDYDMGFTGDDIASGKEELTLFSKAALVESIQRSRNGEDEGVQLRRAVAQHIDRSGAPDSITDQALHWTKAQAGATGSTFREFYEKYGATGIALARRSEGYKNVFNALTFYSQRAARLITQAVERDLSKWTHATLANEQAVTEVLLNRTINRWGEKDPALARALSVLTPEQREMYTQARKMLNSQLLSEFRADQQSYQRVFGLKPEVVKVLVDDYRAMGTHDNAHVTETYGKNAADFMDWYSRREEQVKNLLDQGYFPERRYGDHAVHIYMPQRDTNGVTKNLTLSFSLHEGKAAALRNLDVIKNALRDFPEMKAEYAYKFKSDYNGSMGYQQFLDVARRNGVQLTQTEKERVARALLNSDSAKNSRIFMREDIPGMSKQGSRILAEFGVNNSKKIAYSELGHTIEDALDGHPVDVKVDEFGRPTTTVDTATNIWDKDGELGGWYHDLATKTVNFTTNPPEGSAIARNMRSMASLNFLGGSFAAGVVNISALPMNTVPYLSQHVPYTRAMSNTLSALKLALQHRGTIKDIPKLLDPTTKLPGIDEVPGLRNAIKRGSQDGKIIDTEMYQIMGLTRGQQYSFSRPVRQAVEKWMSPFLWSEQVNRIAGFIAAYKTGMEKGMSGEGLYKFATDTVDITHGRFDEANRPGLARSSVGSVLFTFKSWSLFTMELLGHLIKENPKAGAFMLMSLAATAGVEGLPFVQDIENVVDTIAQRAFGSGFNSNRAMRNILKDMSEAVTGTDLSQVAMHGAINSVTGMSFASRVGVGHMIPGSRLGAADADFKQIMMEVLGPAGGYYPNLLEGANLLNRGQYEAGLAKVLPLAAVNAQKAYLQWQRGYASDAGGRKLVDVGGLGEIAQAFGFSGEALNMAYEQDRMDKQSLAYYQQVKSDFLGDIRKYASQGKTAELSDTINAIAAWNQAHPTMAIGLDPKSMLQEIAMAGMPLNQRTFMELPKIMRGGSEFALGLEAQEGK